MIILLYVMDSLRPDFLSCYGYPKQTSPNIDRLAKEGVLFANAFCPVHLDTTVRSLLAVVYLFFR